MLNVGHTKPTQSHQHLPWISCHVMLPGESRVHLWDPYHKVPSRALPHVDNDQRYLDRMLFRTPIEIRHVSDKNSPVQIRLRTSAVESTNDCTFVWVLFYASKYVCKCGWVRGCSVSYPNFHSI